jgi:single-stranded-DNA-specific exonuclease RecJ
MNENEYNISPLVLQLLEKRGFKSAKDLDNFLHPSDKNFWDPFLLHDMSRLVERINLAMKNDEKVLVFGDYDVDGVSASAILIKYFASKNFYVDYYLPNRYIDGYGLTVDSIKMLKEKFNPSLIITVDCGISCHDEVAFARTLGIEIAVTDHHDIPDQIPDGIVVNPKLENQKYPFKYLCGTGVAFKVVQALCGLEEAKKYLGICAIATIADIVPLVDENRAIVKLGMADFEHNLPKGIKMLFEENKLPLSCSSTDIAFKLSPKINAPGRMGDASVALKLYIKDDKILLKNTIENLGELNTTRQSICNRVYEDVKAKLAKINIANYNSIVLANRKWDSGILGIVAAKVANEFNRPTILFQDLGEELKGSARSVNDIDIFSAISSLKEVLDAFGGHKMAAGLTIKKSNFVPFLANLNKYLDKHYLPKDFVSLNHFDLELKPEQVTSKFVQDLAILEPCGCGNPKPIVNLSLGENATFAPMPKHPNHITVNAGHISIVAFNSYKYLPILRNSKDRQISVELQENTFKNRKYLKGVAKNITTGEISKPKNNDILMGEYLKQLSYVPKTLKARTKTYLDADLQSLVACAQGELFGTLFVCSTYSSYKDFCTKFKDIKLQHFLFEVISNSGINSIVISPTTFDNFGAYKRIVFLDAILDKGFLAQIGKMTNAILFVPKDRKTDKSIFNNLKTDRATFGEYFKLISNFASKQSSFYGDADLFRLLSAGGVHLDYKQFIFCFYVFLELKIFEVESDSGLFTLKENKKVVSQLTNSHFYNSVCLILTVAQDESLTKKKD